MDHSADLTKMKFHNYQIQKWISQTDRAQKVDERNGVNCLVSFFSLFQFLQICADTGRKSKSIKAIFLYPSERSHHALPENSKFYRHLANSSRDIEEWNIKESPYSTEV